MSIYNDSYYKPVDECCKPVDLCDPCNKPTAPSLCSDLSITSQNNTVLINKQGCNVDLSIDALSFSNSIKFNNSPCITVVKEYIDGVLNVTSVLNMECIAAIVCKICNPPIPPNNCTGSTNITLGVS